ncbi:MAG: hypothetical protein P8163_04065 [Candidatus Thiodiazotropha sp.]
MPRNHPGVFDYPGSYRQVSEGEVSARQRIEALQVWHEQLQGEEIYTWSHCPANWWGQQCAADDDG